MMMYTPIQTGIPQTVSSIVRYHEIVSADPALSKTVYCFWTFDNTAPAARPFNYLVLPDGCMDIVFDVSHDVEFNGALVMTPSVKSELLHIHAGASYAGIRLLPGAWQADPLRFIGHTNHYDTLNEYNFVEARAQLNSANHEEAVAKTLEVITHQMQKRNLIKSSQLIKLLLAQSFKSVNDMVSHSGYSRRQLQRILHNSVGYTPHDFLKIIRFQRALSSGVDTTEQYADQPHFIRECKRITGMTPKDLQSSYQLMSDTSNILAQK